MLKIPDLFESLADVYCDAFFLLDGLFENGDFFLEVADGKFLHKFVETWLYELSVRLHQQCNNYGPE